MAIDTTHLRTRRALLTAGLGGIAAVVASAIGRPAAAIAGPAAPVLLGQPNDATAITSISTPTGLAFYGYSDAGGGIYGESTAGVGVSGASSSGRGAVFTGPRAQVKLTPDTSASHPHRGQAGDLFVDKSHRLWFCKGGTTWKQIA